MKRILRSVIVLLILAATAGVINGVETLPKIRIMGKTFFYYESKAGETLDDIAKRYGWNMSDLKKMNPEVASSPDPGTLIYYPANKVSANNNGGKSEQGVESAVAPISPEVKLPTTEKRSEAGTPSQQPAGTATIDYTVKSRETIYGIARKYQTTPEVLFALNPEIEKEGVKKGSVIKIPISGSVPSKDSIPSADANPKGSDIEVIEGLDLLTNENPSRIEPGIQDATIATDSIAVEVANEPRMVGVAVILTDTGKSADDKRNKQNKEMEFSRGAITAVDALKSYPFKTRLTVLDGSLPEEDILSALDEFNPEMIITTSDSSLPAYIKNYGSGKEIMVINAFDAKDETYSENGNFVQYLVPTSYMNSEVAEYFDTTFQGYKLLIAGSPDASDSLGASIIEKFAKRGADWVEEVDITEIPELELDENVKYLIYGTPTASKDVKALLENISMLRMKNFDSEIRVMGRPNWVPFTSSLKELMGENYVYMPSRFYFDPEDAATREFIDHYETLFKLRPMKASPVYCATAYDIITYFVPNVAQNGIEFNGQYSAYPTLQTPIALDRVSDGGVVNKGVYVLSCSPYMPIERIVLK